MFSKAFVFALLALTSSAISLKAETEIATQGCGDLCGPICGCGCNTGCGCNPVATVNKNCGFNKCNDCLEKDKFCCGNEGGKSCCNFKNRKLCLDENCGSSYKDYENCCRGKDNLAIAKSCASGCNSCNSCTPVP